MATSQFVCKTCRLRPSLKFTTRAFATSPLRQAIAPESPNYIDVPQSYQPDLVQPPRPKGILPVPRELFPAKRPDKPSEQYIVNVTRDKAAKNVIPEYEMSDVRRYRARMANIRKRHLREGLMELSQRKQSMSRQIDARSLQKSLERAHLIAQAERMDVQLTNVTTPQAMLPAKVRGLSDEEEKSIYLEKVRRVQAHHLRKQDENKDALHNLYMNARSFITTEEQLQAEIDKKFVPSQENEEWTSDSSRGESIWNTGSPPTIAQMLKENDSVSRKGFTRADLDRADTKYRKDQERMKRIAEELTGGKL